MTLRLNSSLSSAMLLLMLGLAAQVCDATTYQVRPDGTGDFPTIQAAIDGCAPGDSIELEDGIFRGEGNRRISFAGKGVVLRSRSGDAAACIVDCEGGPDSEQYGFYFGGSDGPDAVLSGITVRNGWSLNGAGIYCVFGASPRIERCSLDGNTATGNGGGLYLRNGASPAVRECSFSGNVAANGAGAYCAEGAAPTFRECAFIANSASASGGAVHCRGGSSASFHGCDFTGNSAGLNGGGLYAESQCDPELVDCVFRGNECGFTGGAVHVRLNCAPRITNCEFIENAGRDGGALGGLSDCDALIRESVFIGNRAEVRGGACFWDGVSVGPTFESCTMARNRAPSGSGLWLRLNYEDAVLRNTIVATGEVGEAIHVSGLYSVPAMSCCDLFGNEGGDWTGYIEDLLGQGGNLRADPLFCDQEGDDYSLDVRSPCLPGNHPDGEDCGLIGALGLGCGAVPAEETTWGRIKSGYGRR